MPRSPVRIRTELDIPVSKVQEVFPALMMLEPQIYLNERPPFRAFWFANQVHASLIGSPVGFAGVTNDARTHDVFPSGRPTAVSGNYVVEVQILPVKKVATILTGVAIPLENVVSGKLHFLLGQTIKENQKNDTGNSNSE